MPPALGTPIVGACRPSVRELEAICGGEGREPGAPRDLRIAYARVVRKVSIRITWLLLHTRVSANTVTIGGILLGVAGALLLAWSDFWPLVAGLVLLQLSFVIDYSDGEVARYRAQVQGRPPTPAAPTWTGSATTTCRRSRSGRWRSAPTRESGDDWVMLAALVAILSVVRVAYSARDHVLLGLYRDRPELRDSPEFLRAVLARQGGDPERLDLEAGYEQRRAGAAGRGALWRRWTNLGQLLVFPGFVNVLTRVRQRRPGHERARRRLPGGPPTCSAARC